MNNELDRVWKFAFEQARASGLPDWEAAAVAATAAVRAARTVNR